MKHVLLSADGPIRVYSVPDEVAADLYEWADRFRDWMQNAPEASCYRTVFPSGTIGLCFTEEDFIQYLNNVAFPEQPSSLLEELGWANPLHLDEPYRSYPRYNF